jgi:hypothetical protein
MNKANLNLWAILLTGLFGSSLVYAQESANSSGGKAIGVGGTVSYSVGQVFYTTNIGNSSSIAQGVQNAYEIYSVGNEENNFNISSQRWDDSHIAPSKADMDNFMTQLGLLKNHTVYVFFSPERVKYKSKIKRRVLSDLDKNIKKNFNNVCFFNNYNQDYLDSKFVDCHHFNNIGARDYTKLIFNQLKSKKSN